MHQKDAENCHTIRANWIRIYEIKLKIEIRLLIYKVVEMSWFRDEELKLSWFEKLAVNVIKQGKVPQHVAIIMDGNRRFSVKKSVAKAEGHKMGFDKLSQALQW